MPRPSTGGLVYVQPCGPAIVFPYPGRFKFSDFCKKNNVTMTGHYGKRAILKNVRTGFTRWMACGCTGHVGSAHLFRWVEPDGNQDEASKSPGNAGPGDKAPGDEQTNGKDPCGRCGHGRVFHGAGPVDKTGCDHRPWDERPGLPPEDADNFPDCECPGFKEEVASGD